MKTRPHCLGALLLVLPLLVPVHAVAGSGVETRIRHYFATVLADTLADFGTATTSTSTAAPAILPQRSLSLRHVDEWRARVWQAWQQTMATTVQGRPSCSSALMPTLVSLRDSVPHAWSLPERLEPHAVMNYWWGTKGQRPAAGWPLYLYLHGSGPRDPEWQYGRLWALRFDDAPSAYFIPQIPNEGPWYRWWQRSKQWAFERMLRRALATGEIDPWHIYLLGISEGGYGSQRLAAFYADYLAAAGPMAGGEPLKNAPAENCFGIGFSFLTGADDAMFNRNRLTAYTLQAFDSLQALARSGGVDSLYRHRIELLPGQGHHIDYTRTTPWLKTFGRQPWPRRLAWEDFAIDGRHRRGFYNLMVERMPAADTTPEAERRVRYDMTVDGNTVRLDVRQVYYATTERDSLWGIELRFDRTYKPATSGRLRLFLDERLVDMSRPVTVIVNGQRVFSGRLRPNVADMALSCATFFDPLRLFAASVVVEWGE